LTIDCELEQDRWVVRLRGELDVSSSALLFDAAMMGRELPSVAEVVIDFARVTFVDPSGLHALVTVHIALNGAGRPLRIEGASSQVSELLHLTGLAELFKIPSDELGSVTDRDAATDHIELSRGDV